VVQFGQAEQSLDLVVASIYQSPGENTRPRKIPKMLEVKLDYLKKSADEIPVLASLPGHY
jgi:hypothetical protein